MLDFLKREAAMRALKVLILAAVAAIAVTGCTKTLKGRSLAEYCAIEKNTDTDLCAVNGEIVKTNAAVAAVDKKADEAKSMASKAQSTADEANGKTVNCTTNTLRRVKTGSCQAGYTLVGCTQTHYTTRAGGMAILRSISDTECTYNGRVLEVQVRCCQVGAPVMASTPTETKAPGKPATAPVS
jgi:hypothetical protein